MAYLETNTYSVDSSAEGDEAVLKAQYHGTPAEVAQLRRKLSTLAREVGAPVLDGSDEYIAYERESRRVVGDETAIHSAHKVSKQNFRLLLMKILRDGLNEESVEIAITAFRAMYQILKGNEDAIDVLTRDYQVLEPTFYYALSADNWEAMDIRSAPDDKVKAMMEQLSQT